MVLKSDLLIIATYITIYIIIKTYTVLYSISIPALLLDFADRFNASLLLFPNENLPAVENPKAVLGLLMAVS